MKREGRLKARLIYCATSAPQLFISILAILVGTRALNQHGHVIENVSVHHLLPDWAFFFWVGSMILGGLFIIAGVVLLSQLVERAGCAALAGAGTVYVIALFAFHIQDIPLITVWAALTISMLLRYWALGYLTKPISIDSGG